MTMLEKSLRTNYLRKDFLTDKEWKMYLKLLTMRAIRFYVESQLDENTINEDLNCMSNEEVTENGICKHDNKLCNLYYNLQDEKKELKKF